MARRDIIVIGASLGAVEALPKLIGSLPAQLGAAVLVVMHMAPGTKSLLAQRLNAAGPLHAAPGVDGEAIELNRIYVAVPDHHLMIDGQRIRLSRGPRESHARPSVDVLFRSAAFFHGPRVIGIVLTGKLDDGTAGLWAIKDRGGMAIVQSPEEAEYPSMPLSALRHVEVDHTLKIRDMAQVLRSLTAEDIRAEESGMRDSKIEIETRIALEDNALDRGVRSLGNPSFYTCPDCHGSMVAIQDGTFIRFRCHTGHAYTASALSDRSLPQIERTLWAALAQLEEREVLLRELEQRAKAKSHLESAAEYAGDVEETRRLLLRVRELALDPALSRERQESKS